MKTQKAPHLLDIRIRERMLASGQLDAKALEEHLSKLPDLEAHGEVIPVAQPALVHDDEDDEDDVE